jgi:phosphatidylglycerophosphate synthase
MDRARLQRIRNFQSQDWYAALVVRPFTILVMLVIADWKFVTPNRVTTLANASKLGAAWCILDERLWVATIVLLQLGCLLDHLDGTIARYRGTFTKVGSFYDKVSDIVTWGVLMGAAGWRVYQDTGEPRYLVLGLASVVGMDVCGYTKWLSVAETERVRWLEARRDPAASVARYAAPIVIKPPPERTLRDWVKWFFLRLARVLVFDEMDLWFWMSLSLVIGHLDWCMWLLGISQVANMVVMTFRRAREMARADRRIAELEREREATQASQASVPVS